MSSETLEVTKRDSIGSLASRKLRLAGHVPAILYGHGEENVNLAVKADAIQRVIQHGSKLLTLTGAISETALLKDVQWDAFGSDVLHIDLTRVSTTEAVEVTLPVELHGEAPGVGEGGQLAFALHQLTINCPASAIPESLQVNISQLQIGQAIHASEVTLPSGATMVTPESDVVVQVNKPSGAAADSDEETDGSEPEVITKGKGESDENDG